jgi:hypothetical protein
MPRDDKIQLACSSGEITSQIRSLREGGHSLRQIGAAAGLSHGYVARILKAHDIAPPPKLLKPAIPRRQRNGQTALSDFQTVSDYEAKGLTVKDA